jgi:hypothetical protein
VHLLGDGVWEGGVVESHIVKHEDTTTVVLNPGHFASQRTSGDNLDNTVGGCYQHLAA